MKNRIKRSQKQDIDALIKDIEAKQKKILASKRDLARVEAMGKIRLDKNGNIDENGPTIEDLDNYHLFNDLIHKGQEGTFSEADFEALKGLMPSMLRLKDGLLTVDKPVYLGAWIGEDIGRLPVEFYLHKHHEKGNDEKTLVSESLTIGNMLLDFSLEITDRDIRAFILHSLLDGLDYLTVIKDRLDFGGFDLFYDEIGNYKDAELKQMEETFKRRGDLPKDNAYRRNFVKQYIDNEVYNRFYSDANEVEYTAQKGKEWDKHYNDLCDEYGESEYKRHFTDEDYKAIERPRRKGRDALLLCHYPLCYNRARQNIELEETAKRHGIDEALINNVIRIVDNEYAERLPQIEKKLEELERAGDTPTS